MLTNIILYERNIFKNMLACIAADSFPFPGEIEQGSKKVGERRSMPRMSKKLGRSLEGVSEEGEEVGRKGIIVCSQSQTFYRSLFAHKWGAIVQFDWLLAHQS